MLQATKTLFKSLTPLQRRQLLVLTSAGAVLQLSIGVVLPAFPTLAADFGLGAAGVSLLVALPSTARLLLNLPMGRQADKVGRVPLMVLGEFLAGIGTACTGLATSLYAILSARILVGVGGSMASAGSHAYLADLTNTPALRPSRGIVMGIQAAAFNAAWVAGPALGGLVCELYGPRLGFVLVGAAIGLCGAVFMTLPETLRSPTHSGTEAPPPRRSSLWTLLRNPTQQGVLSAHFALTLNYSAMTIIIPLHAAAVWGATAGQIGLLFSAVSVLSLLGAPMSGLLSDSRGRKAVIIPSLLFMAAGAAALGFVGSLPSFVGCCVLWAIGEAFFVPPTTALTADCAPAHQKGEALALSRQVGDVGFALGPLALGIIFDCAGPAATLGLVGLVNAATAAFVAMRVVEVPAQHPIDVINDTLPHLLDDKDL